MRKTSRNILNDKNHTFVIAEAGSNWRTKDLKTSVMRAKKMINVAKASGAGNDTNYEEQENKLFEVNTEVKKLITELETRKTNDGKA